MARKRKLDSKPEPSADPTPESGEEDSSSSDDDPNPQSQENQKTPSAAAADGASDDDSDPSSIQKLIEPFSKEQLVSLLLSAALDHPPVLSKILSVADCDLALRKIFVHGLGWDTTAETLTQFFSQFGEVEDVKAVTDKVTGKSKGYAFILFKHRSGATNALKEPQKKIGNRMTACQLASLGPVPPPAPPASEYTQRKIFVSNVAADIDPQKLLQFFSKFGEIEEGPLGLDKATRKPKGFCLFVYKTVESAKKALEVPHKNFEGHVLHCQKAVDGPKQNKPGYQQMQHGGGAGIPGGSQFLQSGGFVGAGNQVGVAQGVGHLMAPSGPSGLGFNQAAAAPNAGLNPALGQALTALLATQGAGLGGLTNLLGGLGGGVVNQGVQGPPVNSGVHGMQGGYGNQGNPGMAGGYGAGGPIQGGYGGVGRGKPGGGHMGGAPSYMGR